MNIYLISILLKYIRITFYFYNSKTIIFLGPKYPVPSSATSEPEGNIKIDDEHEENNTKAEPRRACSKSVHRA